MSRARRHRIGVLVGLAVLALSCWPLYPWLAGIGPFVLGMPFSMFWLILLIAAVFLTFLWLFVTDRKDDEALDREYRE